MKKDPMRAGPLPPALSAAIEAGAKARREGLPLVENPHPEGSDENMCWRYAWRRPGLYDGGDHVS